MEMTPIEIDGVSVDEKPAIAVADTMVEGNDNLTVEIGRIDR